MNKWIAEFELEDGDTMPEHMDLEYKGARIDFHCKPLKQEPTTKNDLGVDCISREQALEPYKILENTDTLSVYTIRQNLAELPSMGRYDPYTDKFIGEE